MLFFSICFVRPVQGVGDDSAAAAAAVSAAASAAAVAASPLAHLVGKTTTPPLPAPGAVSGKGTPKMPVKGTIKVSVVFRL